MGSSTHIRSFRRQPPGWISLLAAAFVGSASLAYAGNATVAGTATVTPGSPRLAGGSLAVRAPYTGDDNGNNTLLIEWGEDGVNFAAGSQTLSHAASPYTWSITGLDNSKRYQVRITWQDAGEPGVDPERGEQMERPAGGELHEPLPRRLELYQQARRSRDDEGIRLHPVPPR